LGSLICDALWVMCDVFDGSLASLILEDVKALRISEASIFHAFDVCA